MRTAKQPRAIKTRDRILREAAKMFAMKGFHDTKVDQIITAAEVTSGAFFHHFQGKDDLGFAVIDHHMEERCRALDRIEKSLPTLEFQVHLDEAAAKRGLSGDQETGEMARYIVSVIEGAIMLSRTHRDVSVMERQVLHLKEDLKRSFHTADQLKGAMGR